MYAEGPRAYEMANMVLDVAEKFGSERVYTSGAAISITHHAFQPGVWAVANDKSLFGELHNYPNTILMSQAEGRGYQGIGLAGVEVGHIALDEAYSLLYFFRLLRCLSAADVQHVG